MTDSANDRDRAAAMDAVRARESLQGEIDPTGDELVGPGFNAGERRGELADLEIDDADDAVSDDADEDSVS
jgi:hypothetical protein